MHPHPHTPTPVPSEAECLKQGKECTSGLNGSKVDYEAYVGWMQRGHELGYPCCTAGLSACYAMGAGVARDVERAVELARELEQKGHPLGWGLLAVACAEGHGVPLDHEKASAYAHRLLTALKKPLPGLDEGERYSALLDTYCVLNSVGDGSHNADYLNVARACLLESDLPGRYAYYASALLYQMGEREMKEGEMEEILGYLEKGAALGHGISQYVLARILNQMGDPEERAPQLLLGAARFGQASVLGEMMDCVKLSDENFELINHAFWETCNLGVSCIEPADRLPCLIKLCHSPLDSEWHVHAEPQRDIRPLPSLMALINTGEEELSGLSLRLCSADAGVDVTCEQPGSIAPGEAMELSLEDLETRVGKPFGSEFYVRVSSGGRHADMALSHSDGLPHFFLRKSKADYPLQLWWEKSSFGGRVLCVKCTKGCLHHFRVYRVSTGTLSTGCTLWEDEVKRFGRPQFLSWRGLKPGEEFGISCDELPSFAAVLGAEA